VDEVEDLAPEATVAVTEDVVADADEADAVLVIRARRNGSQ